MENDIRVKDNRKETALKFLKYTAKKWLINLYDGDINDVVITPVNGRYGMVVHFYNKGEDAKTDIMPYFLTVPMVIELMKGVDPKKVVNKYA